MAEKYLVNSQITIIQFRLLIFAVVEGAAEVDGITLSS